MKRHVAAWACALALCVPCVAVVASAAPSQGRSAARIDATPNPLPPGEGLASTTIVWATGGAPDGTVMVATNGGEERLFAQGQSGRSVADWIAQGSTYEFRLYSSAEPRVLLARAVVSRPAFPPGTPGRTSASITADPASVAWGDASGSTTIAWTTGDGSDGHVAVSIDGGPERLFARGKSGTSIAPWIETGAAYEFRLYSAVSPATAVATARVVRPLPNVTAPSIGAAPNPAPAGLGLGATVISWTTGNGSDGRVRVSTNGGLEGTVAQGRSGRIQVNWIDARTVYEFRLYRGTTPRELLSAVTVTRAQPATLPSTEPSLQVTREESATRPGHTPATVAWTTGAQLDGVVYVATDGGPSEAFSQGRSGSVVANWISDTSSYDFRLYAVDTGALLATRSLTAKGMAKPGGVSTATLPPRRLTAVRARSFIAAAPNPVPAGFLDGATEISWAVDAIEHGRLTLSVDGAPATAFTTGSGGNKRAREIRAGSTYEFRLYGGEPSALLASVTVTRNSLAPWLWTAAAVGIGLLLPFLGVARSLRRRDQPPL
ncbi:MAG: hypothetical protein ABL982_05250 [Vicinamibacterales bacterium]